MRNKSILLVIVLFMVSSLWLPGQSEELKARFLQRKPMIDNMKNQGIVGENNQGLLTIRSGAPTPEQGETVRQENGDRLQVYREIAQKLGTSPDEVGRRRAAQIAQNASPGHWLQDAQGNWYRK